MVVDSALVLALAAGLPADPVHPGAEGGVGLAIRAAKVLTCAAEGPQYVDRGIVLVSDGRIEAVGPADEVEVPEDYHFVDVGKRWLMPGMLELHCHVAGSFDFNDPVYLANPGLRAESLITPDNELVMNGLAAGVTSMLFIPGSSTNMGGQGILLKVGRGNFEDNLIRRPGSLKLAQAGNPERWGPIYPGRSFQNWHTRTTFERGLAYAQRWAEYEANGGEEPLVDPQWEIFRKLYSREVQISAHTQGYQVELMSLTMVNRDLGLDLFVDHGTFDGWRLARVVQDVGAYAIVGPRQVDLPWRVMIDWSGSNPERYQGIHAGYQELGFDNIGFNTDSHPSTIPQEELPTQAAIAVHYGFRDDAMQTVRGLTIIPAQAVGIDDRLGSLEPEKLAAALVVPLPESADDPFATLCSVPQDVRRLDDPDALEDLAS